MAVHVIKRGCIDRVSKAVHFIVRFLVTERIALWMAQHGGWVCIYNVDRCMGIRLVWHKIKKVH